MQNYLLCRVMLKLQHPVVGTATTQRQSITFRVICLHRQRCCFRARTKPNKRLEAFFTLTSKQPSFIRFKIEGLSWSLLEWVTNTLLLCDCDRNTWGQLKGRKIYCVHSSQGCPNLWHYGTILLSTRLQARAAQLIPIYFFKYSFACICIVCGIWAHVCV